MNKYKQYFIYMVIVIVSITETWPYIQKIYYRHFYKQDIKIHVFDPCVDQDDDTGIRFMNGWSMEIIEHGNVMLYATHDTICWVRNKDKALEALVKMNYAQFFKPQMEKRKH